MSLVKARSNRTELVETEPTDDLGRKLRCYFPGCQSRWSVWIEKGYCSFHQWGKWPYIEANETAAQREIKAGLKANRPRGIE